MTSGAHGYPNLHVSDHPLVKHKVTLLSDVSTEPQLFRMLVNELTELLVYEATRSLPIRTTSFQSPLEESTGSEIAAEIGLVPILRAGLGMVDAAGGLLPRSTVYHLGIYRDEESHLPVSYYNKLPSRLPDEVMILLDPMLATGGSATAAATTLKANGVEHIIFVGMIAAPEGVERMLAEHPEVPIHVARLDRELDSNKYIRPGLGDAGDRLFGTLRR
ncbi:MAG: uracil phosphoribosyltransferase [Thermomicrobiales bacterium]|nr:uracil phosphoribosyltransferase [Thermomicrobiales bacterium]